MSHSETISITQYESAKDLMIAINGEISVMHNRGYDLFSMKVESDENAPCFQAILTFGKRDEVA